MILGILIGGAVATFLLEVGNRDATILIFGIGLLGVWIREWNLHLLRESDRATSEQRWNQWIADGVLRREPMGVAG